MIMNLFINKYSSTDFQLNGEIADLKLNFKRMLKLKNKLMLLFKLRKHKERKLKILMMMISMAGQKAYKLRIKDKMLISSSFLPLFVQPLKIKVIL